MRPIHIVPLFLVLVVGIPSCKIVKTQSVAEAGSTGAAQSDEIDPIGKLATETFEARLLPHVAQNALEITELDLAITGGLDAAGAEHGNRGAGAGAAWNFAVKGEGTVVGGNFSSRSRTAELDTDSDGAADLTLQIGPVIKGTALRDIAPFYQFGDFRDQIEFAQLARAINDLVSARLVLPEGDMTGKRLSFEGVVPLKSATDAWLVTASSINVLP